MINKYRQIYLKSNMQFNKLYNLILLSIISLNKLYRRNVLNKSLLSLERKNEILTFLDNLNNNKLADFLSRFFSSGLLDDFNDNKIKQVLHILTKKSSINTQFFSGTLDLFINNNQDTVDKLKDQLAFKDPDKIPQFTNKQELSDGVVVYKVEDSKAGQNAVRKVVDINWGTDANPWCLIARNADSWKYWNNYNSYPKHIAFKDGKLLAFCANDKHFYAWWNRKNLKYSNIPLLNGKLIKWKYEWSNPELFIHYFYRKFTNILKHNELTGRYDASGDITLYDEDLIEGGLPIPFGEIEGNFAILDSRKLTSLKNAPTKVKGVFECNRCFSLRDIKDLPKEIGKLVILKSCPLIPFERRAGLVYNKETGLWDANYRVYITDNELKDGHLPYKFGKVKGYFSVYDCSKLFSLEGCPEEIPGSFDASCCHNLKSLVGGPKRVGGNYNCAACWELKTLLGAAEYVGGNFNCNDNHYLLSVEGSPKVVKGHINWSWCDKLKSLKGCPDLIGGNVDLSSCHNLEDLDKLPSVVKSNNNIKTQDCYKLDAWAPYTGERK